MITVYDDFIQGSAAWDDARRGLVTASTIGQLITLKTLRPAKNDTSRGLLHRLLAERVTGETEDMVVTRDMERGHLDEPIARDIYAESYQPNEVVSEVGFITRMEGDHVLGYSPDGLVGDDGLIEIKSRLSKEQIRIILDGTVPATNMAQLQCGLYVTGREWIDYVSYSGGLPLQVIRVFSDDAWQTAISDAWHEAERTLTNLQSQYDTRVRNLVPTERVDHFPEMY